MKVKMASFFKKLKDGEKIQVPLPVVVMKEGKLYSSWSPMFDIASVGNTHEEAIKNLQEAISLYLEDPDAKKIKSISITQVSIENVMTPVPKGVIENAQNASPLRR